MSLYKSYISTRIGLVFIIMIAAVSGAIAQNALTPPKFESQEVSEIDGYPVVMKNLPEWETVKPYAKFAASDEALRVIVGDRPFVTAIDMSAGTEAAYAEYPVGKMLLIEYMSPQASVDADNRIIAVIAGDPTTAYRRIGNYNVIVFDAADSTATEALIEQVKYEKLVHWLGENPFLITPERAFVMTTRDVFIATVTWIVGGFGIAILCGVAVGFVYFQMRDRRRRSMTAYSDAGGMTRLNLDEFSQDD